MKRSLILFLLVALVAVGCDSTEPFDETPETADSGAASTKIRVADTLDTMNKIRYVGRLIQRYMIDSSEGSPKAKNMSELQDILTKSGHHTNSRDITRDGFGNKLIYECDLVRRSYDYKLTSVGLDAIKGTEDDIVWSNGNFTKSPKGSFLR